MTSNADSFDHELKALTAAASEQDQLIDLTRHHVEGLHSAALMKGLELDESTLLFFSFTAGSLARHQMIADSSEQRQHERELLCAFVAAEVPQQLVETVLSYYPMEPLTEEDTDLVAEGFAKSAIVVERKEQIEAEIESELAKIGELADTVSELPDDIEVFLHFLSNRCYELRYRTDKSDRDRRRVSMLEYIHILIDKRGLPPDLRQVAAAVLEG